jgi:hypothetical protein
MVASGFTGTFITISSFSNAMIFSLRNAVAKCGRCAGMRLAHMATNIWRVALVLLGSCWQAPNAVSSAAVAATSSPSGAPQGSSSPVYEAPGPPTTVAQEPPSQASPDTNELNNVSTRYDFRIELEDVVRALPPDAVQGPRATISIFHKGTTEPFQRVTIDVMDERAAKSDDAPKIIADDFDFDGNEDFAVHDADSGSYGGPSYSVFLYRAASKQFVRSAALSNLTEQSLGFPDVDHVRHRLRVFSKSGCCIHWASEYGVIGGIPLRMKTESEEAAPDEQCILRLEERRADGTWLRTKRPCPKSASDPEPSP